MKGYGGSYFDAPPALLDPVRVQLQWGAMAEEYAPRRAVLFRMHSDNVGDEDDETAPSSAPRDWAVAIPFAERLAGVARENAARMNAACEDRCDVAIENVHRFAGRGFSGLSPR